MTSDGPEATQGRYAEAADGLLRTTVLDSIADLVLDNDWDRLSMAKIAAAAGVSRQTLYNEFGDRDGLMEAYVIREAGLFLDGVEVAMVEYRDSLDDAVIAAFRTVLSTAADHPVVHAVVTGQASMHVFDPLVSTSSRPVIDLAASRISSIIDTHWPGLDPVDVAAVSDALVRLAISYLTQGVADVEGCLDTVRRSIGPTLTALTESG